MEQKISTREKIITESLRLFYEEGVHWVSFQKIGEAVGISQPGIYRHFKDKDDLICACVLAAAQSGRSIIDGHIHQKGTALQRINTYIEGNFIWLNKKPMEAAILLAMYYFAFVSPPLQNVLLQINSQSVERLSILLSQGNHEKNWKIKKTSETARAIHDLLMGEMIKSVHSPSEMPMEQRMKFVCEFVKKMIMA